MNEIVVGIVTGIGTGIGATLLSLWQVRAQRLWEKKEDAYGEIAEALHKMRLSNDVWYDAYVEQREISDKRNTELEEAWSAGRAIVLKYADVGTLLISANAEAVLNDLCRNLRKRHEDYFTSLDENGFYVKVTLDAVKKAAVAERRHVPLAWLRYQVSRLTSSVRRPKV